MTKSKPRKQPNGRGSVYRRKDGQTGWIAAATLPNGRRVKRSAPTQAAAIELLAGLIGRNDEQLGEADAGDGGQTTGDWLRYWSRQLVPGRVKDTTALWYRQITEYYLIPELDPVPLAALRPEHVERMMRNLVDAKKSVSTATSARKVLN